MPVSYPNTSPTSPSSAMQMEAACSTCSLFMYFVSDHTASHPRRLWSSQSIITVRNWDLPQNVPTYLFLCFFLFLLPPHGTPASSLACLRTNSLSLQRNMNLTTTSVGKVTGLEWVYMMVTRKKYSLNRILCVKWVHHYTMASSYAADIGDIIQVWRATASTVNR